MCTMMSVKTNLGQFLVLRAQHLILLEGSSPCEFCHQQRRNPQPQQLHPSNMDFPAPLHTFIRACCVLGNKQRTHTRSSWGNLTSPILPHR